MPRLNLGELHLHETLSAGSGGDVVRITDRVKVNLLRIQRKFHLSITEPFLEFFNVKRPLTLFIEATTADQMSLNNQIG